MSIIEGVLLLVACGGALAVHALFARIGALNREVTEAKRALAEHSHPHGHVTADLPAHDHPHTHDTPPELTLLRAHPQSRPDLSIRARAGVQTGADGSTRS